MRVWKYPVSPVHGDGDPDFVRMTSETGRMPGGVTGSLRLFDTKAQDVVPVGPVPGLKREATLYVCGITPYDATHLGHAFTYLTFDLVNRVWRDLGIPVTYAQNITDVDDPLLERAAQTGQDWEELAAGEIALFGSDMEALRIIPPDFYLSVSESMPTILEYLYDLLDKGQIYQIDDEYADWYFSFEGRRGFGDESHLSEEEMIPVFAEHGGDPDRPGKRHPLDSLVWRQARPGEPAWDSDLGRGRPGWHIECAAIACSTLGTDIDIQGGGADLVFPHHEMCAIQAQVVTGEPFARAYVHSAMVGFDGDKMSKSKGNLVKVSQLVQAGADPMAVRLALLAHHYQTDWEWMPRCLEGAQERLDLWRHAAQGTTSVDFSLTAHEVRTYLRNNLHADKALSIIDRWAYESLDAAADHAGARDQMVLMADVLLGVAVA